MWKEPMVVVGVVVIAAAVVCGIVAVFAPTEAAPVITIIVGFAGMAVMQLKAMSDAKAAAAAAAAAKVVAEQTREEAVSGREEAFAGREEVKTELKNVAQALSSAEASGVMGGQNKPKG